MNYEINNWIDETSNKHWKIEKIEKEFYSNQED